MKRRNGIRYVAAAAGALIFVAPLVVMVLGSVRLPGLPPPEGFELAPDPIRWANFSSVFGFIPLWRQLANSLIVVTVAVPITVLVASWAGFAIATAEPRVQRLLIVISVIALMIPGSALWVPRFVMFRWMGLVDNYASLIAPALMATTPFYVLLFALVYARIPTNLYEAARLEGLSLVRVWSRVAWPLGKPAVFAVGVLAFIAHWSNFIDPLLYLSDPDLFTVPLGIRALQTLEPTNHPILLAASVIATLPPVIAFLVAQRAFFVRTLGVR